MDVRNYCRNKDAELTAWKVKLYEIISRMDLLPGGTREKIYANVNGVLRLMTELDDRIKMLRTENPDQWQMQDEEIRKKMAELENRFDTTINVLNECGRDPSRNLSETIGPGLAWPSGVR